MPNYCPIGHCVWHSSGFVYAEALSVKREASPVIMLTFEIQSAVYPETSVRDL